MKPAAFLLFAIVLTVSSAAMADKVFLYNGDRLSGTISNMGDSDALVFVTNFDEEVQIPWTHVMALKSGTGEDIPVPASQEETETGCKLESAKIMPQPAEENIPEIEPAAGTEETAKETGTKWSGRINAGASLQDGNSNKKAVTLDGEIKARQEKNRYLAGAEINWAEDEGTVTEDDQKLYGEYDRFLNDKWFVGGRLRFKTDEIAKLDLRTTAGLFSGYQFYERDDLNLQARLGVDYIREEFENADNEDDVAGTWSVKYDQKFYEGAFQLFHEHDFSVPFDDTEAFLFESKSGLRVPVAQQLTGTAEVDFDWDNAPAPGVREEDVTYRLKLGYEW